ncbi:hypothetical protein DFH11DRAFT_1809466 [Phellopilus nigrolimitatus]|nr:hypothetical protein DFH11DRAFT_1809466 [Phellopilus nigrolimitatus]
MKDDFLPSHVQQSDGVKLRLAVVILTFVTVLNVLLPIYIPIPPTIPLSVEVLKREKTITHEHGSPREWDIPLKQVALTVEDSINFQLDSPEGGAQWRAIIPPGSGYITLGEGTNRRHYRLSMFHALECLDTIRQSVLQRKADRETPVSTIQCRSDIQLEQVRSEYGGKSVQPFITHSNCRDWTKVYAEVERLQDQI